jgi:catechol 2,3-dioxygenase-like lactoylglutathione lyase family enzyme
VPAVSLITLGVGDLDRAIAFYEAWGWTRSSASVEGEVAFLHGDTAALALWSWTSLAADAGVDARNKGRFGGISLAMNQPDEASVDRVVAAGEDAGATITKRPTRTEWGGYSAYLRDPDGHVWEVAHNPFWPLRPDGGVDLPHS